MPTLEPNDTGHPTQVALCYMSAALDFLEKSQGFELPDSRRLSSKWRNRLRDVNRATTDGADLDADRPWSGSPPVTEIETATELLVSAFGQACSKIRTEGRSSDAVLDCVITLALRRAHETCAMARTGTRRPTPVVSTADMLGASPGAPDAAPASTAARAAPRGLAAAGAMPAEHEIPPEQQPPLEQ